MARLTIHISPESKYSEVPTVQNKSYIALAVVAVIVLGGGAFALSNSGNSDESKSAANMKMAENEAMAMKKTAEAEKMAMEKAAMEKDAMAKDGAAMAKESDAMSTAGSFSDYDTAKLANAEKGDVVLFFSASWCSTCQEANKNFTASAAPDGLTLLKLDYDKSNDLKKKYGVTYQHTFVQVDKDGKQLKKWHGSTSYDKVESETI